MTWNLLRAVDGTEPGTKGRKIRESQQARKARVERVVESYRPDLLHVSEVGKGLTLENYVEVDDAPTLNKVRKRRARLENELNQKLFHRIGSAVEVLGTSSTRFGKRQPRTMLRATLGLRNAELRVAFLHANASKKGRKERPDQFNQQFRAEQLDLLGGDFNIDFNDQAVVDKTIAGGLKLVRPLDRHGNVERETHLSTRGTETSLDGFLARDDLLVEAVRGRRDTRQLRDAKRRARGMAARVRKTKARKVRRDQPEKASDHRPVIAKVRIPKAASAPGRRPGLKKRRKGR